MPLPRLANSGMRKEKVDCSCREKATWELSSPSAGPLPTLIDQFNPFSFSGIETDIVFPLSKGSEEKHSPDMRDAMLDIQNLVGEM